MPVFEYRAVQLDGKTTAGQFEAAGRQEAFRQLDAKGLRPISLVERGGAEHNTKPGGSNPSRVPDAGREVPPQASTRLLCRRLLFAFVPCFLWPPVSVLLQKRLALSNNTISILFLVPITTAFWLLYDSGLFPVKRRAVRVSLALLTGAALFGCACFLWFALLLLLLKWTGEGVPFPI